MTQPNPFAQAFSQYISSAGAVKPPLNGNRFIPISQNSGSHFVPPGVTTGRFPWQLPQEALSGKAPAFQGSTSPASLSGPPLASVSRGSSPIGLQTLRPDLNSLPPTSAINGGETPYDILTRWGKTLSDKLNPLAHKLVNLVFESDHDIPTVENPLPIGAILPNKAFQTTQPTTSFAASRYLSISQLRKQTQSVKV